LDTKALKRAVMRLMTALGSKTIEARQPLLKLSMSRRTWYRRRAEQRVNQMESNPAARIGPEQELTVTWSGPYAFPGFERDGLPVLPDHGGVYLQAFAHGDGFLIYAPGEAGNFRTRFGTHRREYRRGEYNVLDAEQAQAGVRSEVWHGWGWSPEKRAEYARREVEIQLAVTRQLAATRIFVSNDLPKRERCRLEGAIIRHLYADGAPLPDKGMFAHRAFGDHPVYGCEAPITVRNVGGSKLHGLPERLLIEGPSPPNPGRP
jgi:hypothetical protein